MELVTRNYQWSEVTKNIGKYMNSYNLYQRMKNRTEIPTENLITNKIPEKLWIYLTVDFITNFPLVAEKNIIFVMI